MIKVPVPFSWIHYMINPRTLQYILKRIDIPKHLSDEIKAHLVNVIIPMNAWTGYWDEPNGNSSSQLFFVFDDVEQAVMFKLKYL